MNPFKNMTDADVALHNARVRKENRIPVPDEALLEFICPKSERQLHDQIFDDCYRAICKVITIASGMIAQLEAQQNAKLSDSASTTQDSNRSQKI